MRRRSIICAGCRQPIKENEYDYSIETNDYFHINPNCLLNFAHEYLRIETREKPGSKYKDVMKK